MDKAIFYCRCCGKEVPPAITLVRPGSSWETIHDKCWERHQRHLKGKQNSRCQLSKGERLYARISIPRSLLR